MEQIKWIIYLFVVIMGISSCSNKKAELTKLMEEKNYAKARNLLKTLSEEEINSPTIILIKDTLNFMEIDSVLAFYDPRNEYQLIDSVLNTSTKLITNSTQLKDSLSSLREYYAFRSAKYYNSIGSNSKAFGYIQKYLSKQYFNEDQRQIINSVMKDKINGVWSGRNVTSKLILIKVELNALTANSFEGVLDYKGPPYSEYRELSIENGVFDGYELSAQAFILKLVVRGRFGGGGVSVIKGEQHTLVGNVSNDTLRLTIDLNSHLTQSVSDEWTLTRK